MLLLTLPVTMWVTPDRTLTLAHVYKVVAGVALFYGVAGLLLKHGWFGLSAAFISVLIVVLALVVLLGSRGRTTIKLPWLPFNPYAVVPQMIRPFWNPAGFNPNIAGGTLAMLLPVPLAYTLFDRRIVVRLSALMAALSAGAVLLFTQSRGAMVAVGTALVVMLVGRDRRWLILAAALVIGSLIGVVALGAEGVLEIVADVAGGNSWQSAQGRLQLWAQGWEMVRDFPLTGIGFGVAVRVMPLRYPAFTQVGGEGIEHVHNLYLQMGVDLGLPGLTAMLATLLGLLASTWRAVQGNRGPAPTPLTIAILGALVVFAVHGITDSITFYAKAHTIAWTLFGLAAAVRQPGAAIETHIARSESAIATTTETLGGDSESDT